MTRMFVFILAGAAQGACVAEPQYNIATTEQVFDAGRVADTRSYVVAASAPALPGAAGADEAAPAEEVDRAIRAALDRELGARGWTAGTADEADVVVSYGVESTGGESSVSDAYVGRYSTVDPADEREASYTDQELIVDIETPSGEPAWRGSARGRLFSSLGDERTDVIDQAVARLIAQLDDDL